MYYDKQVPFSTLVDETLTKVEEGSNRIDFYTESGRHYAMFHIQDCCESVYIDHIEGDLQRLIGRPLTRADEDTGGGSTEYGSLTWTFYRLSTDREFCHITWRGESNGYYSEGVDFLNLTEGNDNGDA